jgi:hypothetical protein
MPPRLYSFISPEGKTIKTKSVKEFSETYGVNYNSAKELSCGKRSRNGGYCSTHRKAARHRQRFLTRVLNTKTGESAIIGRSIKQFADEHGLSFHDLGQLINGRIISYRGWVLEKTWDLVGGSVPHDIFTEWAGDSLKSRRTT